MASPIVLLHAFPLSSRMFEPLRDALPVLDAPAAATGVLLDAVHQGEVPPSGEPCDFLGPHGCSFPSDLRPFGCAALICEPMRRTVGAEELARVESAVEELERAHEALRRALEES